jgi:CAAX protease family protein
LDSTEKKEFWGPWATAGWGFFIFIVWSIAQIVPAAVIWILLIRRNGGKDAGALIRSTLENGHVMALSILIGSLVASVFLWGVILLRKGAKPASYLGFQPLKGRIILGSLAIGVMLFLTSDLLTYTLGKPILPPIMIKSYGTMGNLIIFILGFQLLGPLFEEMFFRGFLLEGFRRSRLGGVGAVLLTSAAWACLHIQYDAYEVATVFVCGLVMGYLRLKTGSLWTSLPIHLLMNAWAATEVFFYFHGLTFLAVSK